MPELITARLLLAASSKGELLAHIDARTARIAELEREVERQRGEAGAYRLDFLKESDRAKRLEAELAAARKPPEDGEVAEAIAALTLVYSHVPRVMATCDLLTRLTAALKEAEQNKIDWARTWKIGKGDGEATFTTPAKWMRRALAAEAKLKEMENSAAHPWMRRALDAEAKLATARRDALEEAASSIKRGWRTAEGHHVAADPGGAAHIRALKKDTA